MNTKLKRLADQCVVVTGASSGIGLVTSRMAAARGAKLVLAARQESALRELEQELRSSGCPAAYVAADVSREEDVRRIAETAVERFGGFDTWVNNAGASVYGRIGEVPVEDEKKVFETNFWGTVYGCRVALDHLRRRGGAIINIGSVTSDRAMPLQAAYSASKHAMKAYTDALRVEVEEAGLPVSITLVKPTSIDTPFFEHAKNYMDAEPVGPPPVYAPEAVAEAILHAAEHPVRDLLVGDSALLFALMGRISPRLGDKYLKARAFKDQKSNRPAKPGDHQGLERASGSLKERGVEDLTVIRTSAYTKAAMHPVLTSALAAGAALTIGALIARRS